MLVTLSTTSFTQIFNVFYSIFAIVSCLALGYGLNYFIDIIPASLYGMAFLSLGLRFSIIQHEKIAASIQWIIRNMGVCFVPAGVGIMEHFGVLKIHGIALFVLTVVTTLLLMWLVGVLFQTGLKKQSLNQEKRMH